MIILDSAIMREMMRSKPQRQVMQWLDNQNSDLLYLSAISVAELFNGLALLAEGPYKQQLTRQLINVLSEEFNERILPFDAYCAWHYGQLMAQSTAQGIQMNSVDAQIAATCLQHGAQLACADTAHFSHCGIDLINPWQLQPERRLHKDAAEYYVMSRK